MLWYKLFGCGLVLGCGALFPVFLARDRRAALAQIEDLILLFRFLRRGVAFDRLPVGELLRRADGRLLAAFGGGGESLSALFGRTHWLSREAEEIAMRVAASFGKGYASEQLGLLDAALGELIALGEKWRASETGKRRTAGVLGLGAAALAVILLI